MSGLTVIHLSDLHIGRTEHADDKVSVLGQDAAALVAEKLVADLVSLRDDMLFSSHETFLAITGDVTHSCRWEEFDTALQFLRELRERFSQAFSGEELLPDHILCIPGNHDLDLPPYGMGDLNWPSTARAASFKLFIESATEYAEYARNLNPTCPDLRVPVAFPFEVEFVAIDSCRHVQGYATEAAKRQPPPEAKRGYLTDEYLRSLEEARRSLRKAFRIGLMHHRLDDLATPEDEVKNALHLHDIHMRLRDCGFGLLLTGHGHTLASRGDAPFEGTTGHSWPYGLREGDACTYQVLRLDPELDRGVSRRCRKFTSDHPQEFAKRGSFGDASGDGRPVPDLRKALTSSYDFHAFLGTRTRDGAEGPWNDGAWAIVAHCEPRKFARETSATPPGHQLLDILNRDAALEGHGRLLLVDEHDEADWRRFPSEQAVFLVDSPFYNPYVRHVLKRYQTHLAGGTISFPETHGTRPPVQHIEVRGGESFRSNKREGHKLLDAFEDYLLIMRLPGLVAVQDTELETPAVDTTRTIWVIAGIHSKASCAGAQLLTRANLERLVKDLLAWTRPGRPEYFEIVFRVPAKDTKVVTYAPLERVHFAALRPKEEAAMSDGLPSDVTSCFFRRGDWMNTPVDAVHLDPVAGCNYRCPGCIEADERRRNTFLSIGACVRVLCDVKELGCRRLGLYGGEPTLHPEFPALIQLAGALGFETLLVTNGSRLKCQAIWKALSAAKASTHVRVSVDAHSPELYAAVHGLGNGDPTFEDVVDGVLRVIRERVPVTVSMLIREPIVSELGKAVDFWRHKGARALVLRPMTERGGRLTGPALSEDSRECLRSLLRERPGFVLTPEWFSSWLDSKQLPVTEKAYDTCYSALYRIAVSPLAEDREGLPWQETGDAWISLCTYARYVPERGLPYPPDLKQWARTERVRVVEQKLCPSKECGDIVCCRDGYNQIVHDIVNRESVDS